MFKLIKLAKPSKLKIIMLLIFITLQVWGTLYLPTLTADIINKGVLLGDREEVINLGKFMLVIAAITGVVSILATYYTAEISTKFSQKIRVKLFKHTQKLSVQDFKHFNTSSLITRGTNDIEQIQSTIAMFFEMMIPAPFIVVVGLVLAYQRDSQMALILFIAMIIFLGVFLIMFKVTFPLFEKLQTGLDKINEKVGQYISGIRVVRAFNRTELEHKTMKNTFSNYAKINIKISRMFALVMPIVTFTMSVVTVAILWFGSVRIEDGYMQIGDFVALMQYATNILMYLLMAVFVMIFVPRAKVCINRINEVLEYEPEILDGDLKINDANDLSLEFQNVSFSYHDAENPVLHNLNFTCKKGQTTAIIGGTGSGKSTIAKLISRLLDVSHGQILFNGRDIKDLKQKELRERIGFVSQKAFLFSGTIEDNLRHGHDKASLEEINHALTIAQAKDFVGDDLDYKVSQSGKNFSGGQRQRLSIARMLVKKPDIYVFDDSFSALDFKTDSLLRSALKEETVNSIVITVAQRITTIMDANQIIVLDEGEIINIGTHQELLKKCSVYLEIAKSQLSEKELSKWI